MLEHVGRAHLPTFFRKVSQCLEDDGIALIHTIGRIGTPVLPTRSSPNKFFPAAICRACHN